MLRNASLVMVKASKRATTAPESPACGGFPLASASAGAEKTMFKLGPSVPSRLRAALPSQPSASMRKSRRAPNSSSMARTLSRKPSQE